MPIETYDEIVDNAKTVEDYAAALGMVVNAKNLLISDRQRLLTKLFNGLRSVNYYMSANEMMNRPVLEPWMALFFIRLIAHFAPLREVASKECRW